MTTATVTTKAPQTKQNGTLLDHEIRMILLYAYLLEMVDNDFKRLTDAEKIIARTILRCFTSKASTTSNKPNDISEEIFSSSILTLASHLKQGEPIPRKNILNMIETLFPDTVEDITDREKEVLELLASGLSNKEIATRLGVGVRTVETHREHLMRRLDIHNVAGLTKYAISRGLVSLQIQQI